METVDIISPKDNITVSVQEGDRVTAQAFTTSEKISIEVQDQKEEICLTVVDDCTLKLEDLNSAGIKDIVVLTQDEYLAIEPDDCTLYLIKA